MANPHEDPEKLLVRHGISFGFSESDDDEGHWIEVGVSQRGKEIGEINLVKNDDLGAYQVRYAELADLPRGLGIGTALYQATSRYVRQKHGIPIASDFRLSPDSTRVWNGLTKAGSAKEHDTDQLRYFRMEAESAPPVQADQSRFLSRPLGLVQRGWNQREGEPQWWKEDAPRRGLRSLVEGRILICRVLADPASRFKELTGRGGDQGWIVDAEVFWSRRGDESAPIDWVFHSEQRVSDQPTAETECRRLMSWIDRRSIRDLSGVARSGKLAMSKAPKDEGSSWDRLGGLVIR